MQRWHLNTCILIQSYQLIMPIWQRLIRPQPTLWDQCVCMCVCVCVFGPGAWKTLHDAQVSSAESVPYLSPRPICSIHTQRRQVTATARHYKSTDDHQVLRPYARKNSVNTEYYSWWCLQEVNASKKVQRFMNACTFHTPHDAVGWNGGRLKKVYQSCLLSKLTGPCQALEFVHMEEW